MYAHIEALVQGHQISCTAKRLMEVIKFVDHASHQTNT